MSTVPSVPALLPVVPLPAVIEPAPQAALDLIGLAVAGLATRSALGYRKDYRDFARFTGSASAEAALAHLIGLGPGQANALALAYLADQADRRIAPATAARRLAALQRAVKQARKIGLTRLVLEVDRPRTESHRDTTGPGARGWKRLLGRAVLETEKEKGKPVAVRNLAILLLLHDRALRRGELVALDHPADLDLERPAVHVLGKGKQTKEWLTLNDRTRDALRAWIALRGETPGPLLGRFDPVAGAHGRLDGETVNRLVQRLAGRAKLERAVTAHALRHEAITEALDAGWDVRDVRHFSRHSKIDTVLIYDDRRKDLGGEITRSLGQGPGRRRRAGK